MRWLLLLLATMLWTVPVGAQDVSPSSGFGTNVRAIEGCSFQVYSCAVISPPDHVSSLRLGLNSEQMLVATNLASGEQTILGAVSLPDNTREEVRLARGQSLFDFSPAGDFILLFDAPYYRGDIIVQRMWDAQTLAPIELPFASTALTNWSPDGQQVLVAAAELRANDYYLWSHTSTHVWAPRSGTLTALATPTGHTSAYWDTARGQVLLRSGANVTAFDIDNGGQRAAYTLDNTLGDPGWYTGNTTYRWDFTGAWLVLRGSRFGAFYNLDTGASFVLNTDAQQLVQFAISPSGRYVAAQGTALRVWDTTALATDVTQRTPIARFDVGVSGLSIRFDSDDAVAFVNSSGTVVGQYVIATGVWEPAP